MVVFWLTMSSANAAATTINDSTAPTITSIMVKPVSSLIRSRAEETLMSSRSPLFRRNDGLQSRGDGLSKQIVFCRDVPVNDNDNITAIESRDTGGRIRIEPCRRHRAPHSAQIGIRQHGAPLLAITICLSLRRDTLRARCPSCRVDVVILQYLLPIALNALDHLCAQIHCDGALLRIDVLSHDHGLQSADTKQHSG